MSMTKKKTTIVTLALSTFVLTGCADPISEERSIGQKLQERHVTLENGRELTCIRSEGGGLSFDWDATRTTEKNNNDQQN